MGVFQLDGQWPPDKEEKRSLEATLLPPNSSNISLDKVDKLNTAFGKILPSSCNL
jgi:hypothetical protein